MATIWIRDDIKNEELEPAEEAQPQGRPRKNKTSDAKPAPIEKTQKDKEK